MTEDRKLETLWDLCDAVCQQIEAKPLNYNQGSWEEPIAVVIRNKGRGVFQDEEACGTAFCRAGHMCAILDAERGKRVGYGQHGNIELRAKRMLIGAGCSYLDVEDLFRGSACEPSTFGTRSYVAEGIEGMRCFMARYADQLKSTKLADIEKE